MGSDSEAAASEAPTLGEAEGLTPAECDPVPVPVPPLLPHPASPIAAANAAAPTAVERAAARPIR